MLPFFLSLLLTACIVAACQAALPSTKIRRISPEDAKNLRASHGLWLGLLFSTALIATIQGSFTQSAAHLRFGYGPAIGWLIPASIPLLFLMLKSDLSRPKSERHLIGLLLSGLALSFFHFDILLLSNPIQGTIDLHPLLRLLVTVGWLVLLVSILELVSLIPLGVFVLTLTLCGVLYVSGGLEQSVAASLLMGLPPGAVIGRAIAKQIFQQRVQYSHTEIFLLGLWITTMLNVSFMKSIALTGIVLPISIFAVVVILITLRAFERSLILRNTPQTDSA